MKLIKESKTLYSKFEDVHKSLGLIAFDDKIKFQEIPDFILVEKLNNIISACNYYIDNIHRISLKQKQKFIEEDFK